MRGPVGDAPCQLVTHGEPLGRQLECLLDLALHTRKSLAQGDRRVDEMRGDCAVQLGWLEGMRCRAATRQGENLPHTFRAGFLESGGLLGECTEDILPGSIVHVAAGHS